MTHSVPRLPGAALLALLSLVTEAEVKPSGGVWLGYRFILLACLCPESLACVAPELDLRSMGIWFHCMGETHC